MVFTSGRWPSQYRDAWRLRARQLRQKGVELYVVGVGSSVDQQQLNDITENTYVGNDLPSITPDLDYDTRTGLGRVYCSTYLTNYCDLLHVCHRKIMSRLCYWNIIHYSVSNQLS